MKMKIGEVLREIFVVEAGLLVVMRIRVSATCKNQEDTRTLCLPDTRSWTDEAGFYQGNW